VGLLLDSLSEFEEARGDVEEDRKGVEDGRLVESSLNFEEDRGRNEDVKDPDIEGNLVDKDRVGGIPPADVVVKVPVGPVDSVEMAREDERLGDRGNDEVDERRDEELDDPPAGIFEFPPGFPVTDAPSVENLERLERLDKLERLNRFEKDEELEEVGRIEIIDGVRVSMLAELDEAPPVLAGGEVDVPGVGCEDGVNEGVLEVLEVFDNS